MRTIAVLPVKRFADAKQRLAEDLPGRSRVALVQAMLADVLIALKRSRRVDGVIVVTGDEIAERLALNYEAEVLADDEDEGHSEAAARGVELAVARRAERVLLVPGDCPALDPAEVDGLLDNPPQGTDEVTIVPDRHGTGTNALLLVPPRVITPAFGEGSRERHVALAREAGAAAFLAEPSSLLLDVDTRADIEELTRRLADVRGGAAHTRGLLPRMT